MGIKERVGQVLGWRKKKESTFVVTQGTQQSVDIKSYMMNILQTYEQPEGDLELYRQMVVNIPILTGAVNAYTRMINAGFDILCQSDSVREKTWDVIERIDLEGVLNRVVNQLETYGFCGVEIVLNDDKTEIMKLKVIDSRTLRVQKDKYGNIVSFKQVVGVTQNQGSSGSAGIAPGIVELDPETVMYFQRNPDSDSSYGVSLLRSLPFVTSIMLQIEEAIGKIYYRYGSPKFHVKYTPEGNIPDEMMAKRIDLIRDEFANLAPDADFFSNGEITIDVLNAGQGAISFTEELRHIVEQMLSGLGLPAAVLGYNYGSTETHTKEQGILLVSNLRNSQNIIARQLENVLFNLMARIYDFDEIPEFEWDPIQIRDEYQDAQTDELKIQNIMVKRDNGIIDQDQAAVELGYRKSANPEYRSDLKIGRYTAPRFPDSNKTPLAGQAGQKESYHDDDEDGDDDE